MAWPEVQMKPFGGHTAPTYRVRDKIFVGFTEDRKTISFKGAPGVQQVLVGSDPKTFFVPKYSGPKGWIGVRLHAKVDWDEIAGLVEDSYRMIAPKTLVKKMESP